LQSQHVVSNAQPALARKILMTDCADAQGLIAKITSVCFNHQLNIIKNSEFVDNAQGRFFMRTELEGHLTASNYCRICVKYYPFQII